MDRIAVRCASCLSVGFIEGDFNPAWTCGICGGKVELMGKVEQNNLLKEEWKAPCDKRCTHARGPLCDCKCKCENHGSGKEVKVIIIEKLPTLTFNDEEALERKREFDKMFVEKLLLVEKMDFFKKLKAEQLMQKALDARQHAARMRALRAITE